MHLTGKSRVAIDRDSQQKTQRQISAPQKHSKWGLSMRSSLHSSVHIRYKTYGFVTSLSMTLHETKTRFKAYKMTMKCNKATTVISRRWSTGKSRMVTDYRIMGLLLLFLIHWHTLKACQIEISRITMKMMKYREWQRIHLQSLLKPKMTIFVSSIRWYYRIETWSKRIRLSKENKQCHLPPNSPKNLRERFRANLTQRTSWLNIVSSTTRQPHIFVPVDFSGPEIRCFLSFPVYQNRHEGAAGT